MLARDGAVDLVIFDERKMVAARESFGSIHINAAADVGARLVE